MSGLLLPLMLMTLVAVGAVLWPVFRNPTAPRRESFEIGVYKDQLAEIDRDLERGLIAPAEARAARLEVERRLLRVAGSARDEAVPGAPAQRRLVLVAALLVPVLAVGLYGVLGQPQLPDRPFAARDDLSPQDGQMPDIAQMVAGLEARLAAAPEDLEGWLMLGRSKAVLGEQPGAVAAYRKAQGLAPEDPRVLAGLGESLVANAGGVVTPEAKQLFGRLQELEPAEPRAPFYLGWAEAQAGDYQAALERWRALLAAAPADAPWRPRVEEAVRSAAQELRLDPDAVLAAIPVPPPTPDAAPQPSPEEVARLQAMPPEERDKMIRGMVEQLAARLEADGSDPLGWLRLAQAYEVLKEPEKVRATFTKALGLHPDHPELLKGYAASLLGPVRQDTGLPEIGPEAGDLYAKAAQLAPNDPEPQWYLGIRALQEGRNADARAHWQRVLAGLDPSHPEYAAIKTRLDQLGG